MAILNCELCDGSGLLNFFYVNHSVRTVRNDTVRCDCENGAGTSSPRYNEEEIDMSAFYKLTREGYTDVSD